MFTLPHLRAMSNRIALMPSNRTVENVNQLRAEWSRFLGDTHSLTFRAYVRTRFQLTQATLSRCGLPAWSNPGEWLANVNRA